MAPMDPRRPRIPAELAERIDAARGNTPFERYVRELLTRALDMSGEELFRQRIERTPPPAEAARQPPQERRVPPPAQGWRAPRRT
jgi:hypothetical protein